MVDLIKNVKFRKCKEGNKTRGSNFLQRKMKEDLEKLRKEKRVVVDADKTQNKYLVSVENYEQLVKKSIEKEYKKSEEKKVK